MAHSVTWLAAALDDLDSIAEYIASDSPAYASTVVARLLRESRSLVDFPYLSRVVPEIGDQEVRERFVYSYRLIYEVTPDRIIVLGVLHGARLMTNEWIDRRR